MPATQTLYLVTGMPGAGKTTFARLLAQASKACLIDIDTATEPIVQAAMERLTGNPDDRDSPLFKETFRSPIYRTLFALADENLAHTDAIVTGPFTKELSNPSWLEQVRSSLKTSCRVRCTFIHCHNELRKERLLARDNPRDRSKIESWEEHLSYYQLEAFPAYPHLAVDTGDPAAFDNAIRELLPEPPPAGG